MGNAVSMPDGAKRQLEGLHMSNGLTAVFIDVLVLSGTELAESDREKEFIIWLAQQDQSVVGIGTVGFSLEELPWSTEGFVQEQQFLLRTVEGAIKETGWERLCYEPRKEVVKNCLTHFADMIRAMSGEDVDPSQYEEWSAVEEGDDCPTIPIGYPKCEKHRIYLSCHGCVICNYERGVIA